MTKSKFVFASLPTLVFKHSKRRPLSNPLYYFLFLLIALVPTICLQRAKSSTERQNIIGSSANHRQQCSTCSQEGEQRIYAPLVSLPESSGTEINLNCRSPHEMTVTPLFYTKSGDVITGESFKMEAAQVKTV